MAKRLGKVVKPFLNKATQSALLAVEVYNKPAIAFKSSAYISLMVIAWTGLFHAYFLSNNTQPYQKARNGRFKRIDGDYAYWGIDECVKEYWGADVENPIRKNIEFFIPLRNKIEHRHLPELDATIFGECQSLLLNFDYLVGEWFGGKHQLRESLSFSLQLFPSANSFAKAVSADKSLIDIKKFIDSYRSSISQEITNSGQYSFKAFLIQVANHNSDGALPIQFIHYDKLTDEQKSEVDNLSVLIKYKHHSILNNGYLKPKEVVIQVQKGLGDLKIQRNGKLVDKFNLDTHVRCFKKFNVRPPSKSTARHKTETKYCIYDQPHNDYLYTKEWVKFLIAELADDAKYGVLYQ